MDESIQQLIKIIMETAPQVWKMARTQVLVETIVGLLQYIVLVVVTVASIPVGSSLCKKIESFDWSDEDEVVAKAIIGFTQVVLLVSLFLSSISGLIGFVVPRLLNPDWYAIEVLRSLLPR